MAGWQEELAELLRELGVTQEEPGAHLRSKGKATRNDAKRRMRAQEPSVDASILGNITAASENYAEPWETDLSQMRLEVDLHCAPGYFVDAARRPGQVSQRRCYGGVARLAQTCRHHAEGHRQRRSLSRIGHIPAALLPSRSEPERDSHRRRIVEYLLYYHHRRTYTTNEHGDRKGRHYYTYA